MLIDLTRVFQPIPIIAYMGLIFITLVRFYLQAKVFDRGDHNIWIENFIYLVMIIIAIFIWVVIFNTVGITFCTTPCIPS